MQTGETIAAATARPAAAAEKPGKRGFTAARKIFFLTVLAHALCGVGASVWIVQTYHQEQPRQEFRSVSSAPGASHQTLEHKVQMKRKAMSAPVPARRATTTGLAKVALPPMPAMDSLLPPIISPAALASGMGGVGFGATPGGNSVGNAGAGFAHPGGTMSTVSIGGLNVRAKQLAVVLDISGSVAQYQDAMQKYVAKTFPGSEVGTFSFAAFSNTHGRSGSIGTVMLGFLNSPKKFDAIYVFSDFDETHGEQDAAAQIQQLIRDKKVRLYLHILREPGKEPRINDVLQGMGAFARSTGGNVKIGIMPRM